MNRDIVKFKVVIGGQQFNLISDEPHADLVTASELLDETLKTIFAGSPAADAQKAYALAAMQIALSYVQLEKQASFSADQQAKLMDLLAHVDV